MKNIIIGQLLLWLNVATILIGWYITEQLNIPKGIEILLYIIALGGSISNIVFSVGIQAKAYSELEMINFD